MFLFLQNTLANQSVQNWPFGKDESNFVSMTIKTSMLFLIIYLSCSNLLFIAIIFKFPKTSLLEFLVFRALRELERLYRIFSSLIKTISCLSLMPTWFGFVADKFPEFTNCKLLSIEIFSSCQKDLLKWLTTL